MPSPPLSPPKAKKTVNPYKSDYLRTKVSGVRILSCALYINPHKVAKNRYLWGFLLSDFMKLSRDYRGKTRGF